MSRVLEVVILMGCSSVIGYQMGYSKGHYDGRQMGSEDTLDVLKNMRLPANAWQKEAKRLYENKKLLD